MNKDYKELEGKLRYELIDPVCLESLAKVLTYGVEKYGEENKESYTHGEFDTYYAALMRHLESHRKGDTIDGESGLKHLEHALFNMYAMLYIDNKQPNHDCVEKHCNCRQTNIYEYTFIDGKVLYDDEVGTCEICGQTEIIDDLQFDIEGNLVCTDCYDTISKDR